jgi:hypothetical protein
MAVEGGMTLAAGSIGYAATDTMDGALTAASVGNMVGSATARFTVACFAAGTPLVVDFEGNSRSIEDIEVGDYVLARSEFDAAGPLELKRVEEKFVRVAPVMELVVRGQVITTTAEHPFFVAGEERFIPAGELTLDDQLVDSQGRPIAIDAIRVTDRLITVYNLRVADFHTYFVGGKLWQFDVWVHNASDIYDPSGIAPRRAGTLADLGEGPEARAVRVRSDFEVGATRGSVIEEHHVFPQEMQRMFAKRGIDVHDFVIDLEVPIHKAIHGGGDWKLARQNWTGE